jgi:tetratricopeptide (TPR) repeat protein
MDPAPPIDVGIALVGSLMLALLVTLIALALRTRRRERLTIPAADVPAVETERAVDGAALLAAVGEAEAAGQTQRLPGLYLSLAQWRRDLGETDAAEDLLRKSIRAAASAGLKETHAKARVALGDIAQAKGDPATACEHWQIARGLFHELKRQGEHDAVDARMQRNGCPTDWVLTDF